MHDATGLTGPHKQQVAQHLALAMMKAEDRYWSVWEAAEAIREPLQQIPGDVAADLFLAEARKSGLLVEREHGVYGFAHLTLQEYLAAAQLGTSGADTALLTSNVDVSWWRETILLWSADNNATPIVAACLAHGTVPALALAFDCAAQAQVAPAVRERLEAELAPPAPGEATDPARQRLRTGVLATRTFREAIPVDETAALCTHAVPRSLYDLFVREEEADGRHHSLFIADTGSDEERRSPAEGMRIGDAERFVVWLNSVTGDPVYRLPSLEQLRQPAAAGATALQDHTVWASDGSGTVLHQPPGVHWPYTSGPEQLRSIAVADREQLMLYLRFMGIPAAQSESVEAWASALTTALQHVPARRSHPRFASLELALILALAFTLDLTRTNALATDLAPYGALARSLGIDYGLTYDLSSDRTRERARVLDRALDRTLGRARTLDPNLARDRDPSLDPGLALARDLARARAHARDLAHDPAFSRGSHPDPDLDLFDPGLYPRPAPDPELALAIAEALGLHPDQALNPDYAPAFALPLALARTHDSHIDVQRLALASFRILFSTYRPRRRARATGSVIAELDTVLTRTAEGCPWERRPPEDPARVVREALALLQTAQRTDGGHRLSSVLALVHDTAGLLTTMRNRRAPSDTLVLSTARTALITAIRALHATGLPTREPVRLLHWAWQSLVSDASTPPSQPVTGNQVLLLVRTQP